MAAEVGSVAEGGVAEVVAAAGAVAAAVRPWRQLPAALRQRHGALLRPAYRGSQPVNRANVAVPVYV